MNQEPEFSQNMDAAIGIMREAGQWLLDSGKEPSKWWDPQNLNEDFLLQHVDHTFQKEYLKVM